jgi:uncharacterized protein YfcZ (UPF0381/DUF406 family)
MDVSIFGYKFNLEVLILIGVVYLILVGHTVCGCCNMGRIMEGAIDMTAALKDASAKKAQDQQKMLNAQTNLAAQTTSGTSTTTTTPVTTTTSIEGFTGANINYGESSLYNLNDDQSVDTSSWSAQNMTVVPGQPLSKGVKQFLAREPQPVPLPEGEMLMFANTPFKPECCPNTYSNSTGCACMTGNQYNYLVTRGGNNVPYSQY